MPEYLLRDEAGDEETTSNVETLAEAESEARYWVRNGNYEGMEKTFWVKVHIYGGEDGDGDRELLETIKVAIDPGVPLCDPVMPEDEAPASDDDTENGHRWRSPLSIVGGIKESPGVYGKEGGVTVKEVCMRCGTKKLTDSWAQDSSDGEQGLRSIQYDVGQYDEEVREHWLKRKEV